MTVSLYVFLQRPLFCERIQLFLFLDIDSMSWHNALCLLVQVVSSLLLFDPNALVFQAFTMYNPIVWTKTLANEPIYLIRCSLSRRVVASSSQLHSKPDDIQIIEDPKIFIACDFSTEQSRLQYNRDDESDFDVNGNFERRGVLQYVSCLWIH